LAQQCGEKHPALNRFLRASRGCRSVGARIRVATTCVSAAEIKLRMVLAIAADVMSPLSTPGIRPLVFRLIACDSHRGTLRNHGRALALTPS
jgi:hypothetical protein